MESFEDKIEHITMNNTNRGIALRNGIFDYFLIEVFNR